MLHNFGRILVDAIPPIQMNEKDSIFFPTQGECLSEHSLTDHIQ